MAGRSRQNSVSVVRPGITINAHGNLRLAGGLGGAQVGCNAQFSNFVVGPEVEVWGQDFSGSAVSAGSGPATGELVNNFTKSSFVTVLSGRLGYALGNALFYGKGGIAITDFGDKGYISSANGTHLDLFVTSHKRSVGYMVGGGLEFAVSTN